MVLKRSQKFVFVVLLGSVCTSGFFIFPHCVRSLLLLEMTPAERLDKIDGLYGPIALFLKEQVRTGSTIGFFNAYLYTLERPRLYPDIECQFLTYWDDPQLLEVLQTNSIGYLLLVESDVDYREIPLTRDQALFTRYCVIIQGSRVFLYQFRGLETRGDGSTC